MISHCEITRCSNSFSCQIICKSKPINTNAGTRHADAWDHNNLDTLVEIIILKSLQSFSDNKREESFSNSSIDVKQNGNELKLKIEKSRKLAQ